MNIWVIMAALVSGMCLFVCLFCIDRDDDWYDLFKYGFYFFAFMALLWNLLTK